MSKPIIVSEGGVTIELKNPNGDTELIENFLQGTANMIAEANCNGNEDYFKLTHLMMEAAKQMLGAA